MGSNLDFIDVDMEDFDFQQVFKEELLPIRKTAGCKFKECIQVGDKGEYFCKFHKSIVFKNVEQTPSAVKVKKIPRDGNNDCAAIRCRKRHADDTYLCDFHDLEIKQVAVKKSRQCKNTGCERVKVYSKNNCCKHVIIL